jgi:electron transfer flavoprotein alpha subunit
VTVAPRIRRDPRAATNKRIRAAVLTAEPEIVRVDNPACTVLAVMDAEGGRLSRADREAMAAARKLADSLHGAVVMLAGHSQHIALQVRPEAEGADAAIVPVDAGFAEEIAETRVPFVVAAAALTEARHILFPETPVGGELARRVAARLDDWPATRVVRLSASEAICIADAGRCDLTRPLPRILVPAPEAFAPLPPSPLREARRISLDAATQVPRVRVIEFIIPDPRSVALAEAELIIGAGGGLSNWQAFHEAALLLGAAEGGSRVVCDAGLLPRTRQVGVSGVMVSPRCYLAFGIAGASQHLQGIADAERVVAVNSDRYAPIMHRADLAIAADAQVVLPALVARARARGVRHAG